MAALAHTARRLEALGEPPPPPPHRLAPGRQRLLAEAAQLRSAKIKRRKEQRHMTGMMKLGTALLALVLVVGLTFGASQAAADSLPGEPLYGFKLAAEEARLALTTDPEDQAALNLALAEERLDEIATLLEQGQAVDEVTAERVERQLNAALEAAPAQALEGLAVAIQQRQRTMEQLAGETPDEPLRQIIREMERVRQEAHAGQGIRRGSSIASARVPLPSRRPCPTPTTRRVRPGPKRRISPVPGRSAPSRRINPAQALVPIRATRRPCRVPVSRLGQSLRSIQEVGAAPGRVTANLE